MNCSDRFFETRSQGEALRSLINESLSRDDEEFTRLLLEEYTCWDEDVARLRKCYNLDMMNFRRHRF